MSLETSMLFHNHAEKNKNVLTLLVAQALFPMALNADPVSNLILQYEKGVVGPSVDFFSYHSTRLTTDGNYMVDSPYKKDAKILVKALAYMDEAHVDYLLQYPNTPAKLNNQQFVHMPLRRVFSNDYQTLPLLQAMLGRGLRVLKREQKREALSLYGYDITTTTLSVVFDPKLQKVPTSICMKWPSALNVKVVWIGGVWTILWPQSMLAK